MADPLQFLWPAVEAARPVFSRAAVVRWPKGVHAQLVAAKLIVPDGTASRIRCPQCGRTHRGRPIPREQPDRTVRFFIPCPKHLRAEVTDRDLQQWAANIEELAKAIAAALSVKGRCKDLGSGRVWRCGRTEYQGVLRDVLLARGLRRKDAARYRRAITGAHRPIVFVGMELPENDFWQGRVPTFVRLCEVASLRDGEIDIDVEQVVALIRAADEASDANRSATVTLEQLKLLIRQQVKAEGKAVLKDDWLVSAYKRCSSYRKAAKFLSEEAKQTVTKDQVFRAVKRAGGLQAVVRGDDSESVVRTVSSRRRDTPIEKRDSRK